MLTAGAIHSLTPPLSTQVTYPVGENQRLCVSGNCVELGEWEVTNARAMEAGPNNSWQAEVWLPERSEFEYQYLVVECDTTEVVWSSDVMR